MAVIRTDRPLDWRDIAAVAAGEPLHLSGEARERIAAARHLVEQIVARGIRAYGVNTGVGALCDVVVSPAEQHDLSHNILMSHAVGVGAPLGRAGNARDHGGRDQQFRAWSFGRARRGRRAAGGAARCRLPARGARAWARSAT